MPRGQSYAADSRSTTTHWPHIFFLEANRLAAACDKNYLSLAIGDGHIDESIVVPEVDSDDAACARA